MAQAGRALKGAKIEFPSAGGARDCQAGETQCSSRWHRDSKCHCLLADTPLTEEGASAQGCVHPAAPFHCLQAGYTPLPLHITLCHLSTRYWLCTPSYLLLPQYGLPAPRCHLLRGQGLYPSLCHLLPEETQAALHRSPHKCLCYPPSQRPQSPPWGTGCEHLAVTAPAAPPAHTQARLYHGAARLPRLKLFIRRSQTPRGTFPGTFTLPQTEVSQHRPARGHHTLLPHLRGSRHPLQVPRSQHSARPTPLVVPKLPQTPH